MVRIATLVLVLAATVSAFDPILDPARIQQALSIGGSRLERDRTTFHAPYRLPVDRAPIDYIDIVTPFRRLALAAEQRMRLGDRSLSQRQAMELLDSAPGVLDVLVELTFHPMHALVRVPEYEVRLLPPAGKPIAPRSTDRVPRFGPRLEGSTVPLPGVSGSGRRIAQPMLGGTAIASFDGLTLNASAVYDVVVMEKGKELARARLELGKLR